MQSRSVLAILSISLVVGSSAFAGVHVVDAGGAGDFTTIQAAVDASVDGDLILVNAGQYAGFTIDDKQLTVVAHSAVQPAIQGTVEVKNLAGSRVVALGGFSVEGHSDAHNPGVITPALKLTSNAGAVRVQNSTLLGGHCIGASDSWDDHGAHGTVLDGSLDVSFANCALQGGDGGSIEFLWLDSWGGNGGHALTSTLSNVALYDCALLGGKGGSGAIAGGTGGTALNLESGWCLASNSSFQGGHGGNAWGDGVYQGFGGDGIDAHGGSTLKLLDDSADGGVGGVYQGGGNSPSGADITGAGSVEHLSGPGRKFTVANVSDPQQPVQVKIEGSPGDQVFFGFSRQPAFHYAPAKVGVSLLHAPAFAPVDNYGTIPASGVLFVNVGFSPLAPGETYHVELVQGFVISATSRTILASPMTIVRAN